MHKWHIEKRDTVNKQRIFSIEKLLCYHPAKKVNHDFYILNNPDWVNIVTVDTDGNIVLVKQHRLGTDEYTIETVAGLIDPGEDPYQSAHRELLEETGYRAQEIVLLKKLAANPAIMNNYIYFYCALNAQKVQEQSLDLAEDIEIVTLSPQQVLEFIQKGTINHSIIITALLLYFLSPYSTIPKDKILLY
ncbi:MAG TPA: NUDIX hydrolase [Spirochaetota bacterium]|nr:NUDIX hydrolase [Spirochaetota bacterium]HOM10209.1 NUDIX hydrolase [Spirochaetota bacterium]HPP49080.1 NUDIX hydrolase [Spirochaetota bacterium]